MSTISFIAQTDVGKVRTNNEDNYIVLLNDELITRFTNAKQAELDGGRLLLVVADGMGGHNAGEVASQIAVQTIVEYVKHAKSDNPKKVLEQAVLQAHNRIVQEAQKDLSKYGMGTTVVLAYIAGNDVHIVWVGDSRAYCLKDGKLHQITKDHSLVQELIDRGVLRTKEEIENFPEKNVITQSLGGKKQPLPSYKKLSLNDCDVLLLCSDGLNSMIDDEHIERILVEAENLEMAANNLISAANFAGGKDNITVALLKNESKGAFVTKSKGRVTAKMLTFLAVLVLLGVGWWFARDFFSKKQKMQSEKKETPITKEDTSKVTNFDSISGKIAETRPSDTVNSNQNQTFQPVLTCDTGDYYAVGREKNGILIEKYIDARNKDLNDPSKNILPKYYKIRNDKNKWGFAKRINDSCFKVVIFPKYKKVYYFHEGFAFVKLGSRWIVIDTLGNLIKYVPNDPIIWEPEQGFIKENGGFLSKLKGRYEGKDTIIYFKIYKNNNQWTYRFIKCKN